MIIPGFASFQISSYVQRSFISWLISLPVLVLVPTCAGAGACGY